MLANAKPRGGSKAVNHAWRKALTDTGKLYDAFNVDSSVCDLHV